MILTAYTTYTLLKLAHVLAAVVWVGGGAILALIALRSVRGGNPYEIAGMARTAGWVGPHVFSPASLVLLVSGCWMMVDGSLPWDQGWIVVSLVAWAVAFLIGNGFMRSQGIKVGKLAAELGVEHPEVQRVVRRAFAVSRIDAMILLVVVAVMTVKPAGWDLAILVLVGVVVTAGVAIASREPRRLTEAVASPSAPSGA